MNPMSRMRLGTLIAITFVLSGAMRFDTDKPVVSGSPGSAPAGDLVLLPDAPRWVRWASTGVFLRYTVRGQALLRESTRAGVPQGIAEGAMIPGVGKVFNKDASERPQNETSIAIDPADINRVVGLYHDYRLGATSASGWTISRDGGLSLGKDGYVPSFGPTGCPYPRCVGAEPTVDTDSQGNFFVSSLFADSLNGIVVARSPKSGSPQGVFSAACAGGGDTDCWPTVKRVTANTCSYSSPEGVFDDNPVVAVDDTNSPAAGHVYVVWTRFACPAQNNLASATMVAKCNNTLSTCTPPVTVDLTTGSASPLDFVQQPHIAIAPGGGVYITWVRHSGSTMESEVAKIMLRKIQPTSSTSSVGTLGALRAVHSETRPIPWGFAPYPAYFRTATRPRVGVSGKRVLVVWDRRTTPDVIWAQPGRLGWWVDYGTGASIAAKYSDDYGVTWSGLQTVTNAGGPQYQPGICVDPTSGKVAIAYYSHQNDPFSGRAQDVYLAASSNGAPPYTLLRVTAVSNDPQADPILSDVFIGDHLDVACRGGIAYVHFTANYATKWFGSLTSPGFYGNQQDNFLTRIELP